MTEKPIAVDIGCGATMLQAPLQTFPQYHWIGVDRADMTSFYPPGQFRQGSLDGRLPFDHDTVDFVWCHHVLEHLPHLLPMANDPDFMDEQDYVIHVVNEMWRILKPGSEAHIVVPWHGHPNAWRHPTHYRYFAPDYFTFFSWGYPGEEHRTIDLWSKWQILRSEIVDQTHVYAIFKCLRWASQQELLDHYGPAPNAEPWWFRAGPQ